MSYQGRTALQKLYTAPHVGCIWNSHVYLVHITALFCFLFWLQKWQLVYIVWTLSQTTLGTSALFWNFLQMHVPLTLFSNTLQNLFILIHSNKSDLIYLETLLLIQYLQLKILRKTLLELSNRSRTVSHSTEGQQKKSSYDILSEITALINNTAVVSVFQIHFFNICVTYQSTQYSRWYSLFQLRNQCIQSSRSHSAWTQQRQKDVSYWKLIPTDCKHKSLLSKSWKFLLPTPVRCWK